MSWADFDSENGKVDGMAGRPRKGDRATISAKVPTSHKPILEHMADEADLPLCDFVAVVLSEALGLDAPTYLDVNKEDIELPGMPRRRQRQVA